MRGGVEQVVDWSVGGEVTLGRALGLELLLLSSPDRQMAVLGAIVCPHTAWPVAIGDS